MDLRAELIALLLGALQGVFEWLPISSEGNITVILNVLGLAGGSQLAATQLSLFLHVGTAVSATVYYRDELADVFESLPAWRPETAFEGSTAELSYLVVATLMTGVTGAVALLALQGFVEAVGGGGPLIVLIGALLIGTGLLQRFSGSLALGSRDDPDLIDAVAVGSLQGLAILPGVSRSGVTSSALLFRGHDGASAFRLSFILSIPAALGAGALAVVEDGGVPLISPVQALIALATAAVVGYLTIDALMRVVERFSFWGICLGLGGVMVVGGLLLL